MSFGQLFMIVFSAVVGYMTGGVGYAVLLGSMALLSTLMMPKPEGLDMKPASLSDFQITSAREGTPIALVYGRVKITSNIIWYGNLEKVEKKEDVGGKGGGDEVTVGYEYYIDLWQSICIGKIRLIKVLKNEEEFKLSDNTQNTPSGDKEYLTGVVTSTVNDDISYYIFNDGTTTDHPTISDTNVANWIETKLPKVSHIFFKRFKVGMNNTFVPTFQFLVERDLTSDVPLTYTEIIDTTTNKFYGNNPVAVVYDLLVNQVGFSSSLIDINSFNIAGAYYDSKKLGINLTITSQTSLWEAITKVMSSVDSILYLNDEGKFAIKILKDDDISIGTIQDDFIEFNLTKQSIDDLPNEYKANLVEDGVIKTVYVENPALKSYTKTKNVKTFDLTIFNDKDVALQKLYDFVKKYSYPFATLNITVPAKYSIYNLGDIVTIINTENNINADFRIMDINEENIDKNEISMTLIQQTANLFDVNDTNLVINQPSYAVSIDKQLYPLENIKIYEIAEEENTYIFLVPSKTGIEAGYHIYISDDDVNYTYYATSTTFSNYYTLNQDYTANTYEIDDIVGITLLKVSEAFTLQSVDRKTLFNQNLFMLVDDEVMKFQTVTPINDTTIKLDGIIRGVGLSYKASHTVNAPTYISILNDNVIKINKTNIFYVKIVPFNAWDTLSLSDVTAITVTPQLKGIKPMKPARIVATRTGNNIDVLIYSRTRKYKTGSGIIDSDNAVDTYPFEYEGKYAVKIDNNSYQEYDNAQISITNANSFTLYVKTKENGYYSDEVSLFVDLQDREYIYNDDE